MTYSAQASASTLQSQDAPLIAAAIGRNGAVSALVALASRSDGDIATGASHSTRPLTLTNGLYVQTVASNAGIVGSHKPITLPGPVSLTLIANGPLAINA